MRFTERELTLALTGVAKTVHGARDKGVRKGQRTVDEAWEELSRYRRWQLLDGLGDQLLPVLVALPDVEVRPGERATFTREQVTAAVEERLGEGKGVRRAVQVKGQVALVELALQHLPPRADPDALVVPDHL
ncbi:hypothetical protein [Nocardioides sp. SYSU D00038]|uniref:hypothetical protein n=1 Tax=Nocardioides sp. SYSU D00038 TaxID=2812554 RepID=UPI00196751C1|nr:hypothetical protein [Nocardioides sp. SYSU D00038]